ncbi:molybdate transport system ATP-binding protein [Aquabacterium commune]|uniref:Molybdate transport system ATP-binding protein n=1 Tax=Aquabacterium commune TaxID=70586 RepID=A0A4R6RPC4_9BURK|nr:molybdenum ABC transporter ATP-binding protein [Aquabacterium commune]TDP88609.1 molybdate transport system ATP-binding protein [Aquabacterium commune]
MNAIEADLSVQHPGLGGQPGFSLDVALRLPGQGVSVLLGPSGCGKTTVLRALAGLGDAAQRARGRVQVGGEVWQDDARGLWRPVHQRPIGVVFQEASLFEHLTVQGNLDYGWRRVPPAQRRLRHDDVIPLLGIGHLLQRRPQGLSGGERQRVAIARALLTSPALLLMDEPLSALDAARKAEVLPCLERLGQTGVPVVYVTHALDEAARLADHLVVLRDGRVQAAGPAEALWTRLDTPLSASDDAAAVLSAEVVRHDAAQGLSLLQVAGRASTGGAALPLWTGLHMGDGGVSGATGQRVRVRVLARDVSVSLSHASDSSILNILPAVVAELRDDAQGSVMLSLQLGTDATTAPRLLARITRRSAEHLGLRVGQAVFAQVKGVALLRG